MFIIIIRVLSMQCNGINMNVFASCSYLSTVFMMKLIENWTFYFHTDILLNSITFFPFNKVLMLDSKKLQTIWLSNSTCFNVLSFSLSSCYLISSKYRYDIYGTLMPEDIFVSNRCYFFFQTVFFSLSNWSNSLQVSINELIVTSIEYFHVDYNIQTIYY